MEFVLVEDALPAVLVTMNRPEARNALSTGLMSELTEVLLEQSQRPEVRVVILRGAGPAFSAGHDLGELTDRSLDEEREVFAVCTRLMDTIQQIPQPVIAAVHGPAFAAGCQLVATCDLAVAADTAKFATPGVKIGLFCSTPMVAVSRNIGRKRALEMLLTGRPIDAATAAEWGLVNKVVPPDEVDTAAVQLANDIASYSPLTLRIGKHAFYEQVDAHQDEAYESMSEVMAQNAMTEDGQEGMTAFLQKREPVWKNK